MVNTSNNISFDVNVNQSAGFSECVYFNLKKTASMIGYPHFSDFISCSLDYPNAANWTCEVKKNESNGRSLSFQIIPIFESVEIKIQETIKGNIQCEMALTSHKNDVHDFYLHFNLSSYPNMDSKQSLGLTLTRGGIIPTMTTILVIVVIVFVSVGSCLCYRDFRVKREMKRILQIYKSEDIR